MKMHSNFMSQFNHHFKMHRRDIRNKINSNPYRVRDIERPRPNEINMKIYDHFEIEQRTSYIFEVNFRISHNQKMICLT